MSVLHIITNSSIRNNGEIEQFYEQRERNCVFLIENLTNELHLLMYLLDLSSFLIRTD